MIWEICLFVSLAVILLGIIAAVILNNSTKKILLFRPLNVIIGSVVVSAVSIFIPIYSKIFAGEELAWLKTVLISIHNTIRLFIVDGEFDIITENLPDQGGIYTFYSVFAAMLFVAAPILTFEIVLTFFKNVSAYRKYLFSFNRDVYIFSELNSKSICLAKSIYKDNKRNRIIFTDVFDNGEEAIYELIDRTKHIKAILFKDDIALINFKRHSKAAQIYFFAIGIDEEENIVQSIHLVEKYRERNKTHLYVFASGADSEIIFSNMMKPAKEENTDKENIKNDEFKLRMINEPRHLIYSMLYDDVGDADEDKRNLFASAKEVTVEGEKYKKISVMLVGLGSYGSEMLKAVSWYCQLDGYRLFVDAFDVIDNKKDVFSAECPDLIDPRYNNSVLYSGEAFYNINIHTGVDISTVQFDEMVNNVSDPTYVFVALGNDVLNINTAMHLRTLFKKKGLNPVINTIVFNDEKSKGIQGASNHQNIPYDIIVSGSLPKIYSKNVIIESELERKALDIHEYWGGKDDSEFWNNEYNYKSSVSCAIQTKAMTKYGNKDRHAIEEHRRWLAYTRSEGYTYGANKDHIAKTHPDLISWDDLPEDEKEKNISIRREIVDLLDY